ncbi:3-oxoadipate enol-lactonase [Amorphus sp. MBR-141]
MARQTIRIPGCPELACDVAGDGPDVVFVHGIGGNRSNWSAQLDSLSETRRTIAIDLRGYGDSDDASGPLDFFDFVSDIARTMDFLGAKTAHMVGLSMGALVVQAFYARFPQRVSSLTLAACRPGDRPVFDDPRRFAAERIAPSSGDNAAIKVDEMLPRLLGPAPSDTARAAIRASLEALHPAAYRKTMAARLSIEPFLDMATIDVPTLVVAASHDTVAPCAQMQAIAAQIPHARYEVIDDAGHLLNIEKPSEFNAILASFLQTEATLSRSA